MTDALPTELLITPAEMSETTLTNGSQALLQDMAFSPTNLDCQYMMRGRIQNNYEGRWQHPELTGQHFGTKSVTSQFKHSHTSTPEHPSSRITRGCQSPLLEKYWSGRDLNPGLSFT